MILHVDMDAFFASIEQRDHPELRGLPVIVGGSVESRGVVSTCSYEARRFGVHSAMPMREARRLCPDGIFVPTNMALYESVSRELFSIFDRYTPLVEGLSCDEAFLDVSGAQRLFGPAPEIAKKLRRDIRTELRLTASVGVAPNKFLAKIASDLQKPDGLTIVPTGPEEIARFLAPLDVTRIFGVGKVLGEKLRAHQIHTIRDLQRTELSHLQRWVGDNAAASLHALAFGHDTRSVETERIEKSISREYTFATDIDDREILRRTLRELADDVARQVRAARKFAGTAHIKYRTDDFQTLTRQQGFDPAAQDDFSFREKALSLLEAIPPGRPVRLIGFGVSNFVSTRPETVPDLFGETPADTHQTEKREALSRTLDSIRKSFGKNSIHLGSSPNP